MGGQSRLSCYDSSHDGGTEGGGERGLGAGTVHLLAGSLTPSWSERVRWWMADLCDSLTDGTGTPENFTLGSSVKLLAPVKMIFPQCSMSWFTLSLAPFSDKHIPRPTQEFFCFIPSDPDISWRTM